MVYLEIMLGASFLTLCALTTKSDCQNGLISNRLLFLFSIIAVVLDGIYYGFLVTDIITEFAINVGIVVLISLFLFFTHSFAGGDCKLAIVLALLYPARCYFVYLTSNLTLAFALGIAIFLGYIYLLFAAVWGLITKKNKVSVQYVKSYLLSFITSFLAATIYISLIMLFVVLIGQYGITINIWVVRGFCIIIAWLIGRYAVFKRWIAMSIALGLTITMSIILRTFPFSANIENYLFVLALLLCQMTIKSNLYDEIAVKDIRKGMILSTGASVMMQGSRVRGLPPISSEDLRDRITQEQADSILRWSESREIEYITIVKKIPFAVFLSLGFLLYFIVWSVV